MAEKHTAGETGQDRPLADLVKAYARAHPHLRAKGRRFSRAELGRLCGFRETSLHELVAGRWKPNPEGALQLLRLLRVLKPSAADLPAFLRAFGLIPVFDELSQLFREASMFSIITAETGVTASRNFQWMIQTRMRLERTILPCAVDSLREDPSELRVALEKWRNAARICKCSDGFGADQSGTAQDLEGVAEAHGDFHEAIVNAARRSPQGTRTFTDEQLDHYQIIVRDMLPRILAGLGGVIFTDQGRTVSVDARERHMIGQEDELRIYVLHDRLGDALLAGDTAALFELFDLHWSWPFNPENRLPSAAVDDAV